MCGAGAIAGDKSQAAKDRRDQRHHQQHQRHCAPHPSLRRHPLLQQQQRLLGLGALCGQPRLFCFLQGRVTFGHQRPHGFANTKLEAVGAL